ncbi:MAG: hypothetical protein ACE15E_11900 [Acidobacteriota bacterium]
MSFQHINRRLHLYLGMFLLPWVLVYAVSSLIFSHAAAIRKWDGATPPRWKTELEREYNLPVPPGADVRVVGARVLKDLGMEGAPFFAARPGPKRLNINPADFWERKRVAYFIDQHKVVVQSMENLRWHQILVGFHLRSGYRQDNFLSDLWAFTLDVVCLAFLIWIVSGIYIWWQIRPTRLWGMTALVGGFVCFILLLLIM